MQPQQKHQFFVVVVNFSTPTIFMNRWGAFVFYSSSSWEYDENLFYSLINI
jgi:hypothetical protein